MFTSTWAVVAAEVRPAPHSAWPYASLAYRCCARSRPPTVRWPEWSSAVGCPPRRQMTTPQFRIFFRVNKSTVSYHLYLWYVFTTFVSFAVHQVWGNFFKSFIFIFLTSYFITASADYLFSLKCQRYSLLGRRLRTASDLCHPQRRRRWGRCGSRDWSTCAKIFGSHGQTCGYRNREKIIILNKLIKNVLIMGIKVGNSCDYMDKLWRESCSIAMKI